MEMNIEIEKRDIIALSIALAGRGKMIGLEYADTENNTSFDIVRVKVDFNSLQSIFGAGKEFQEKKEPYTDEELAELEAIYEQEHNL